MTLPNEKNIKTIKLAKPGQKNNSGLTAEDVIKIIGTPAPVDSFIESENKDK